MNSILYTLAIAVCCANAVFIQEDKNRITTGNIATQSQFPYVVSIQNIQYLPNQLQAHRCGGALITFQHVLTAASCMYDFNVTTGGAALISSGQLRIYAGGVLLTEDSLPDRTRFVQNYTVHPGHLIYPALLNDIAIINLSAPFGNTTVVPIPYATNNVIPQDFTLCTLVGWGASTINAVQASNELRYTTKYTYNHDLCTSLYSSLPTTNIHPNMLCAASYDIFSVGCYGDEGSALVCNGQLTGILSLTNGCVMSSFPEVYSRVSNYTTWIRSIAGGASTFKPQFGLLALLAVICAKVFS